MTGGARFAIVLSVLVVILTSCDGTVHDQSTSRSPVPTMPLPTIAGALTLAPQQVILPDAEFPLSGYSVDTDQRQGTNSWTRNWRGSGAFFWVRVDVTVLDPSASSRNQIAATKCDWTFTPPALSTAEIAAPVVGDGAKACGYDFTGLPVGAMVYTTGTRNVLVSVGVWRRSASQAEAVKFVASLADYQLWIIDRVAPLSGVAVRPSPQVQVPTVAAAVTPQPATRTTPPPGTPATPAPVAPSPTSPVAPVAASLVMNSLLCGTRTPNQFVPTGYIVDGFEANLTATGPVGTGLLLGSFGSLQLLDWKGTADPPSRLSADPPTTRVIYVNKVSFWGGNWGDLTIYLFIPGSSGFQTKTFHIFC